MTKITIDMFKTENRESIPVLSPPQEEVLEYLRVYHSNCENPITGPSLLEQCKEVDKEEELRKVVNSLRVFGFKINSDRRGYWYSTDKDDIEITINQLSNRICGIGNAINGLRDKEEPKKYFIQGKLEVERID